MITPNENKQLTYLVGESQRLLQDGARGIDTHEQYSASIHRIELYLKGLAARSEPSGKRFTAYDLFVLLDMMSDLYRAGIRDVLSEIPEEDRYIPEYDTMLDALKEFVVDPENFIEEVTDE